MRGSLPPSAHAQMQGPLSASKRDWETRNGEISPKRKDGEWSGEERRGELVKKSGGSFSTSGSRLRPLRE